MKNFRAWHKTEKRFVNVRNIDFEEEQLGYDAQGEFNKYDIAHFDKFIFQYSTGLKDKNGAEIFEGDIFLHGYEKHLCEVQWKNCAFVFYDKNLHTTFDMISLLVDSEITGNILENS